jgi:hypothetical protein
MVPRWSFDGEKEKKRNERDIEHALGSSQQRHLPVKSRGWATHITIELIHVL